MSYSIGEVAKIFDLSIHTLRYYDKEGLLPNVKRTESGIRKFEDSDIESLHMIECLKKSGMPIKDIKRFMDWCQKGDETLSLRRDMFYERKAIMMEQMADIQNILNTLQFKCWYYDTAIKAGTEAVPKNMNTADMPDDIRELYERTHRS